MNMNVDNLSKLAEWLEAGAPHKGRVIGFNMQNPIARMYGESPFEAGYYTTAPKDEPACGTVCCIAGAAIEFFDKSFANQYVKHVIPYAHLAIRARDLLGLDEATKRELFTPATRDPWLLGDPENADYYDKDSIFEDSEAWDGITPAWAGRCVRNLIATGEVDWAATQHEPKSMPTPEAVVDDLLAIFCSEIA